MQFWVSTAGKYLRNAFSIFSSNFSRLYFVSRDTPIDFFSFHISRRIICLFVHHTFLLAFLQRQCSKLMWFTYETHAKPFAIWISNRLNTQSIFHELTSRLKSYTACNIWEIILSSMAHTYKHTNISDVHMSMNAKDTIDKIIMNEFIHTHVTDCMFKDIVSSPLHTACDYILNVHTFHIPWLQPCSIISFMEYLCCSANWRQKAIQNWIICGSTLIHARSYKECLFLGTHNLNLKKKLKAIRKFRVLTIT